jgi:hypothetical protein
MSQNKITSLLSLSKRIHEDLSRAPGILSQRGYAGKSLNSLGVTLVTSSPFYEIDNVNVGISNSLFTVK